MSVQQPVHFIFGIMNPNYYYTHTCEQECREFEMPMKHDYYTRKIHAFTITFVRYSQSSPTGPAEHWDGGSRDRSESSCNEKGLISTKTSTNVPRQNTRAIPFERHVQWPTFNIPAVNTMKICQGRCYMRSCGLQPFYTLPDVASCKSKTTAAKVAGRSS